MQIFSIWKVDGLTAENDSRKDRYDFGFPNKLEEDEYILIEVKSSEKGNVEYLSNDCKNAINQIENKKS